METDYRKYEPLFGAWRIKDLIGEGSYGKVFEIEREEFGTNYRAALKAITIPKNKSDVESVIAEGMDEESATTYFRGFVGEISNEIALMDKIKGNSNVVNYEDHVVIEHKDDIGWDILIRMELLTPLNTYLKGKEITDKEVVKLGIDLCSALEICEKYNIIHRDIKPENIFVSELGVFKLGDFGIARVAEKSSGASTKVGTNSYMAPEVARGENYSSAVDQYSLGLVMYRLLNNNRLPFLPPAPAPITFSQREEANAKRYKGEQFPKPQMADGVLSKIILKATAFDPNDRYANPSIMKQELEKYLASKEKNSEENEKVLMVESNIDEEKTAPVSSLVSDNINEFKEDTADISVTDVEEKTIRKTEIDDSQGEKKESVKTDKETSSRNTNVSKKVNANKMDIMLFAATILVTTIVSVVLDFKFRGYSLEYMHRVYFWMFIIVISIGSFVIGKKRGMAVGIAAGLLGFAVSALIYTCVWCFFYWGRINFYMGVVQTIFWGALRSKTIIMILAGPILGMIGGIIKKSKE